MEKKEFSTRTEHNGDIQIVDYNGCEIRTSYDVIEGHTVMVIFPEVQVSNASKARKYATFPEAVAAAAKNGTYDFSS